MATGWGTTGSPSMRTVNVAGSTSMAGSAVFSGRSALVRSRTPAATGTRGRVGGGGGVVGGAGGCARHRPPPTLHHVRCLPRAHRHLADATHGLGIGADHGDGSLVVQPVFGGDRRRPDAALGESDVLGHLG